MRELDAMAQRARDMRPAWLAVIAYLRIATAQQFASQGSRLGSAWQPLSEPYGTQKAKVFPGQPILRATDAMFKSLTEETENSITDVEPLAMEYGTKDRKAKYHQDGTPRMPRRQILGLIAQDKRQIVRLVQQHLANELRPAGFEAL